MSVYPKIFVEGTDDRSFLTQLFVVEGEFYPSGNKKKTFKAVREDEKAFGIVDRDFLSDEEVSKSREENPRCAVFSRYALENYLLEPAYLYRFACERGFDTHPDWNSQASVEQLLLQKAQELCHHAAANEQLSRLRDNIAFQELPLFFVKSVEQPDTIREELSRRMEQLPSRDHHDEVLQQWEKRAVEMQTDCQTLAGAHRWINGKILLRDVIYQCVLEVYADYSQQKKKLFVQDLAMIAKEQPPRELVEILQSFGIVIHNGSSIL